MENNKINSYMFKGKKMQSQNNTINLLCLIKKSNIVNILTLNIILENKNEQAFLIFLIFVQATCKKYCILFL